MLKEKTMLIRNDLPQFRDEPALIVVTGREAAEFYHAQDGEIEQLESVRVEMPEPDERPGHFEEGSHGKTWSAGTAFDPKEPKREARRRLVRALPEHIKDISGESDYGHVYIFTPDYMHKEIEDALPKKLSKKLEHVFYGNYTKHMPLDLLESIKELQPSVEERVPPHKTEVKKILGRFFGRKK